MLKTCQIVTRGTATGLLFSALPTWQMQSMHAWFDALRARGARPGGNRFTNNGRLGSQRDLIHGSYSAGEAALYVRAVGVDRIVEALVHSASFRRLGPDDMQRLIARKISQKLKAGGVNFDTAGIRQVTEAVERGATHMSDENEALYGVPPEVIPFADNGHVLADKLLSLGHWVAESYTLWISRPRGTSRAKWQRAAALKFVQALPVPADMYAMRTEPTLSGEQVSLTGIRYRLNERLPEDVRDALVLARTVEDAMLEVHGATCKFTLHALSATRWGVTLGSGHKSATFEVLACSPAAFAETCLSGS